ncbi:MAG TPA: hypothetical protein VML55_07930 [Planctomycetaceae bacterium]|nr:hypothetical protein [Planctomycetaceae bacterium]
MSRPREHNSISLFPFLAVLVCAMGALILLLLVTTRRIRMEAVERAQDAAQARDDTAPPSAPEPDSEDADFPPLAQRDDPMTPPVQIAVRPPLPRPPEPPVEAPRPPPRPIDPNPELRRRIAALARERDQRRQQLQALTAEMESARERAGDLERRLAAAGRNAQQTRAERDRLRQAALALEQDQRRLAAQIHDIDRRLAQAQQQQAAQSSKFVVVPYDGVLGTNRRPILIEFTGEGIRFIPENVLLRKEDFDGFTPGYNPLLAGALALVDYWTVKSRRSPGGEPPPYVLLIVRPSGVRYYPLRLLLERLGQPFGYELLEEDRELTLPDVDPAAAEACRTAVERLLNQRDALMQVVRAGRGPGLEYPGGGAAESGGLSEWLTDVDGPAGGTGVGDGEADRTGSGGLPGASAAGERRGPVFRGYQRPSYDLVEPDSGIVLPSQRRPRVVQRPGGPRGGGPGAIVDTGSRGAPGGLARNTAAPTQDADRGDAAGPAGRSDGSGWQTFQTAQRRSVDELDPSGSGGAATAPGTLRGTSDTGEPLGPPTGYSGLRLDDEFDSVLRGESSPDLPAGWRSVTESESSAPDPAGTPRSEAFTGSAAEIPASGSAASGSAGGSGGGSGGGDPTTPAGAQELAMPSLAVPTYRLRTSEFDDSRPHRRRWGLSNPRATIGYERELRIDASAAGLRVGGEQIVSAADGLTRDELIRRTLAAIDAAARSWGPPPDAFYWVPSLRFHVAPGGNLHYERLRGPLREWGLQSSATYTLDSPRAAERSGP